MERLIKPVNQNNFIDEGRRALMIKQIIHRGASRLDYYSSYSSSSLLLAGGVVPGTVMLTKHAAARMENQTKQQQNQKIHSVSGRLLAKLYNSASRNDKT